MMKIVQARLPEERRATFAAEFDALAGANTPYLSQVVTLLAGMGEDVAAVANAKPRRAAAATSDRGGGDAEAPRAQARERSRIPRPGGDSGAGDGGRGTRRGGGAAGAAGGAGAEAGGAERTGIPDDLHRALQAVRVSGSSARDDRARVDDIASTLSALKGQIQEAVPSLDDKTAADTEGDPSVIHYGSNILLRSTLGGRHLAVLAGGNEVDASGFGVSHPTEVFQIVNASFREDEGPVLLSDVVALRSRTAQNRYLSLDPATGLLSFRRTVAGSAERWKIMPVSRTPDEPQLVGAAALAAQRARAEEKMTHSASKVDGFVRTSDRVRLQAHSGLLLQVQVSSDGSGARVGLGAADAATGAAPGRLSQLWHVIDARAPFTPDWSRERPFLTGTSLLMRSQEERRAAESSKETSLVRGDAAAFGGSASSAASGAPLSSFPPSVQEILLVEDLLYSLLGIEGKYVRIVRHAEPESVTERAMRIEAGSIGRPAPRTTKDVTMETSEFVLTETGVAGGAAAPSGDGIDPSIAYLAKRILPVARHYVRCNWFVERRSRAESGLVGQAVSAAARLLLREYTLLVAKLEHTARRGELSLQKLWFFIQPSLRTLGALDTVLYAAPSATGGALLNSVYRFASRSGDAKARSLTHFLLERAASPYLRMLGRWVFHGSVEDPYGEFMVLERDAITKETMRDDFNANYWDERYTIREDHVPAFLERHAAVILNTGKYLNVLRECGQPPRCPFAEDIAFSEDERQYGVIVQRVYEWASRAVMSYLLEKELLMRRMQSLKSYLLLHQGDFLVHFMEHADAELAKPVKDVSLPRLQALLSLSLRTSIAAADPFKDDITCVLEPTALLQHLETIHNLGQGLGDSRAQARTTKPQAGLKGVDVFSLDYKVEWPLSLVFSKRELTKYQLLFRHLFFCKHVERQLCITWQAFQRTKELDLRRTLSAWQVLRQRMLHFMQNLVYYMMNEVLEPRWHEMSIGLSRATNLDEFLKVHSDCLDTCLKECLLTNRDLLKILTKLTTLCLLFSAQIQRLMESSDLDGGDDVDGDARATPTGAPTEKGAVRRARLAVKSADMRDTLSEREYVRMIGRYNEIFDKFLRQFMMRLLDRTSSQYRSHLANLCTRLDFNGHYAAHLGLVGTS